MILLLEITGVVLVIALQIQYGYFNKCLIYYVTQPSKYVTFQ
jgi:hypothetical protein